VIREGCLLTGLGVTVGLVGAIVVTRMLRGLLYGVAPPDDITTASVVALVAVGWRAWRATRVDPTTALRAE
jgi:hypothetical protein